jgi:hypothetical protein
VWDLQALQHEVHPFNRAQRGEKRGTNRGRQFGRELLRDWASQRFVVLNDRGHASSEEQIERLIQTKIDAVARQNLREAAAAQHLAINKDAVAVENDEIGLGHRTVFRRQSEHMLTTWATTHTIDPNGG